MSEITRYELWQHAGCGHGGRSASLEPMPLGTWMRYEDHEAKVRELEERLAAGAFWGKLVYPDGATAEQVQAELTDYHMILESVGKVYMHVTDGKISKANTLASEVISVADDVVQETVQDAVADAVEDLEAKLRRVEEERDQLRALLSESQDLLSQVTTDRDTWKQIAVEAQEKLRGRNYVEARGAAQRALKGKEEHGTPDPAPRGAEGVTNQSERW